MFRPRWICAALGLLLACGPMAPRRPAPPPPQVASARPDAVPPEARETLAYIRAHHAAPAGFEGGRRFGNYERRLPERDGQGRAIAYQEWDIHPHEAHRNRGAERIVTGSDGRAWYSGDHYRSFVELGAP